MAPELGISEKLAWYGAHSCREIASGLERSIVLQQHYTSSYHAGKLRKWSLGNKELICIHQPRKQGDQLLSGLGQIFTLDQTTMHARLHGACLPTECGI
jgi:hypothetical protein